MTLLLSLIYMTGLASIVGCIMWLMLRSDHSPQAYCFIGNHAMLALWLVSQLLILQAVTLHQLWLSYLVGNFGISFMGMFWLLFAFNYKGHHTSKRIGFALVLLSAAFFLTVLTNSYHKLYYSKFGLDGIEYGILFYFGQAYIYGAMLSGLFMICRKCFKERSRSRGQAILLSAAALIPLSLNLLVITGVLKTRIAVAPLTFTISGVLVLLATYRYDFLNVNSVAFEDALNSLEEGVMVFNRRGKITYFSRAAKELLNVGERSTLSDIETLTLKKDSAETEYNGKTLSIKRYRCLDNSGCTLAHIFVVSDISHYYELAQARQSLAIEQERNRIAQEVHDTAGHTLTMLTSLARLANACAGKLTPCQELSELKGFLDDAEKLSRSGVTQLRCSINDLRDDSFLKTLGGAVRMLCDSVRGLETELTIQGEESACYSFCIREVYVSVRELITNCLRYSSADKMDIILRFGDDMLELYVFDNGKGCDKINEGNGLKGIRERIEALDGTVSFTATEGFQTIIKIPKQNKHKTN